MKKSALVAGGIALAIAVSACGARPEAGQNNQAAPDNSTSLFGDAQTLV